MVTAELVGSSLKFNYCDLGNAIALLKEQYAVGTLEIKIFEIYQKNMITKKQRELCVTRAQYKCEYCHKEIRDENYEIDHIIPREKGGTDDSENLAFSCRRCNGNKREIISTKDPISGDICELFHPRTMIWNEHFLDLENQLRGRTKIGRATCTILLKPTDSYLPKDLNWDMLSILKDKILPTHYIHLNRLRYLREINDFKSLESYLNSPAPLIREQEVYLEEDEKIQLEFIKDFLRMEIFLTRSSDTDIDNGINFSDKYLKKYSFDVSKYLYILHIKSKLLQQASINELRLGDKVKAASFQKKSIDSYKKEIEIKSNIFNLPANNLTTLEIASMAGKHFYGDIYTTKIREYQQRILDSNEWHKSVGYKLIYDLILKQSLINSIFETEIHENCSNLFTTSAYGVGARALEISLRRRWWILELILNSDPNYELLKSDLTYWLKAKMFNEIRSFYVSLILSRDRLNTTVLKEVYNLFSNVIFNKSKKDLKIEKLKFPEFWQL